MDTTIPSDTITTAAPPESGSAPSPSVSTRPGRFPDPVAPPGRVENENPVDVTVVLPCYNEQDHVLAEIERVTDAMNRSAYSYELLLIDDASTDGTLGIVRTAAPRYPQLRIIAFHANGGSGTARRIGTQQARGRIVVWTDADMSYPNERIPDLVEALDKDESIDQIVGARTSEQGSHKFLRVPAKWIIRKLAERLSNSKIPDLNSGLRAFRREVSLPYLRLLPPGFSCVTTITMAFLHNQHSIAYVPIGYAKRSGTSKFHFVKDAYRYILQVVRMVMYFNPLKVLMPPSLVLLTLGCGKAAYDVITQPVRLATNTVLIFLTGLIIASLALLADLIVRSRSN